MDLEQTAKPEQSEKELSHWFSTYGLITAQRILSKYRIDLPQDLLLLAIKNSTGFYHQILQIPLKNVLNGIVIQQAYDYHVYAQKLFIDYLLSATSENEENAQGASTKEALEEERVALVALGQDFHKLELEQDAFIASSQTLLIKLSSQWNEVLEQVIKSTNSTLKSMGVDSKPSEIRKALHYALAKSSLLASNRDDFIISMNEVLNTEQLISAKEKIITSLEEMIIITTDFNHQYNQCIETVEELSVRARGFRSQFYETIVRVLSLIKLLPDYTIDPVQDSINRETLHFDKTIGGII